MEKHGKSLDHRDNLDGDDLNKLFYQDEGMQEIDENDQDLLLDGDDNDLMLADIEDEQAVVMVK